MTKEEMKNRISEHKECCKKLAEEYRQRYNEDKTNKLALNMFYHNVIAYNNFETILSMIEDRNSMIMCFSEPPILTEKTVEVELNRIAELEKENAELKDKNKALDKDLFEAEKCIHWLGVKDEQLTKAKEIIEGLMRFCRCFAQHHTEDIRYKEAEQFLQDVNFNQKI